MSESGVVFPYQSRVWQIFFLLLSVIAFLLFCFHLATMELTRLAALRLEALIYTWNMMNSSVSIDLGTMFLVAWLVVVVILFALHPGHKSRPYAILVVEGFMFGMLLTSLWSARVQIFLQFDYIATAPEVMLFQAAFAIPVYEWNCVAFLVLIAFFTIITWFRVIKFEPSLRINSHFND